MGHKVAYFSTLLGILFGLFFDFLGLTIELYFLGAVLITNSFQLIALIGNHSVFVLKLRLFCLKLVLLEHDLCKGTANLLELVPQLSLLIFPIKSELIVRLLSCLLVDFQIFKSLPMLLLFPLNLSLHLGTVSFEPFGIHFTVNAFVPDVIHFLEVGHLHSFNLFFDLCLLVLVGFSRFGRSLFYFSQFTLDFSSLLRNGLSSLLYAPTPLFEVLGSRCYLSFSPLELTFTCGPDFCELSGDPPV